MRVQLMSDLHLEFHPDHGLSWLQQLDPTGVDVLVLAGDVSLARDGMLCQALNLLCQIYPEVVFVLGNHEFYRSSVQKVLGEIEELARQFPNLHWLENSTVTLGGQRFVGSTLWFPEGADGKDRVYGQYLNDFRMINGFTHWVYARNRESQAFLVETVEPGDIVVTHHIPDIRGVAPRWLPDVERFGRFFLTKLPSEVVERPRYWLFGHTHDTIKAQVGSCQLLCNPYGYFRHEANPKFDPKLVFET